MVRQFNRALVGISGTPPPHGRSRVFASSYALAACGAAGAHRGGHALEDTTVINTADESLLRRAIGIAAHAVTLSEAPYGSLLAGWDGAILAEAHNTVRGDN